MIDIALIGAGRIGVMHAANLVAHPRFRLTGVYDNNADAARQTAALHNIKAINSAEEIFADDSIQAVLIASATNTHCDYLLAAARAGKAVLCEKPLDLDIGRVEQCRTALRRLKTSAVPPIQLGFNRRFDPGHASLQARLDDGEIGKLEKLIITSRDPDVPPLEYLQSAGGLFRDMMIHDFDLARAALPEEPIRVFAVGAVLIAPQACAAADDVDTAMAILQTASGVLCHINCSRRAVYGYDQRVEAFGANGMLISGNHSAQNVEHFDAHTTAARPPLLNFFIERYADSYRLQLDSFADAIKQSRPPSPSFEDGRRALILADAAEQSRRSGRWVEVNFGDDHAN